MGRSSFESCQALQFIVCCLRQDVERIQHLLPVIDWVEFRELTCRHRIGPILSRKISRSGVTVPDDVARFLKEQYQQNIFRTLVHTQVIHRLARSLSDAGIDFMLLKGFSHRVGYDNFADRHVNDLDILVRRESQIWEAIRVLEGAGLELESWAPSNWSKRQKEEYLVQGKDFRLLDAQTDVAIELHFRLFSNTLSASLNAKALWHEPMQLNVDGIAITVLNDSKHLEYLVHHGCACAWFRLKWVVDFYFIICSLSDDELEALLNRAEQGGWRRPLLLSLSVLRRIFNLDLPDTILQAIATDRALGSMCDEVIDALNGLPPSECIHQSVSFRGKALLRRLRYELKLRQGIRQKLYLFSGHGFSPANWKLLPLPASLHFLYTGLHPFIHLFRVLTSK